MDLQSYVRALRKRWRIIVGCTLLALSLAAILTALTPKTYSSTVRFFVSTADSSNSAQLAQGNTFSQDRVKSYTQLMNPPPRCCSPWRTTSRCRAASTPSSRR